MKTRKATLEDLDSVVTLSDMMVKFHADLDPYYAIYSKYEDAREYYKKQLTKEGTLFVVTENDDGEIVAYASAYIISIENTDAPKIGVLVANFVRDEFRGKGIGTAQHDFRMNWFKENGVTYAEMSVDARNAHALGLWKSKGFTEYQIKLKKELD